jgi:hypothetical protein
MSFHVDLQWSEAGEVELKTHINANFWNQRAIYYKKISKSNFDFTLKFFNILVEPKFCWHTHISKSLETTVFSTFAF